MKLFFQLAFVLSAFCSASALKLKHSSGRKMSQVVDLLKKMADDSKSEGVDDEKTYQKFKCHCDHTTESTTKDISFYRDRIPVVEAQIANWKAVVARLSEELAQLTKDMNANEDSRLQAKSIRDKQSTSFEQEKRDLENSIEALTTAIESLSSIGADQNAAGSKTTLAQLTSHQLKTVVARIGVFLNPEQKHALLSLLAGNAPHLETYKPSSSEIVGMLQSMNDTFSDNLSEAIKLETERTATYTAWLQSKQSEYSAMAQNANAKNVSLTSRDTSVNTAQQELDALKNSLARDEEYLRDFTAECTRQGSLFREREEIRAKEQSAISEALSILNSDDAFENFGRTLSSDGTAPSLLQKARAVSLRDAAKRARVANRHEVRADASGKDAFADIRGMVKKLVDVLDAEQETDDNAKSWCTNENEKNSKSRSDLDAAVSSLETEIVSLTQDILTAEEARQQAEKNLAQNQETRQKSIAERNEQKKVYEESMAELKKSQALLGQALVVLGKFYDWLSRKNGAHTYKFHRGVDAGGSNIERLPGATVRDLEAACSKNPDCAGFNTSGWLKSSVGSETDWYSWGSTDADGLYVKTYTPNSSLIETSEEPEKFGDTYDAQSTGSNRVVGLLQDLQKQVGAAAETADKSEDDAIKAFETQMAELDEEDAGLRETQAQQQKAAADKTELKLLRTEALEKAKGELGALAEYVEHLAPNCGFVLANYDERKARREDERSSLNEAVSTLDKLQASSSIY